MNIPKNIKIYTISLILTTVLITFLSFQEHIKSTELIDCSVSNNVFENGENLVYKLYYNLGFIWLPAGEVVFSVRETNTTYEFRAIGKTYKSYEKVFKVNDFYSSSVNKETMFPKNFVRVIEEGNYRLYDSIIFDQPRNIALSYHGKTRDEAKPRIHKLDQCMQDLISNIYYMRNLDTEGMKKGDQVQVKMFFDNEVFPINIRYNGKENKEIKDLGKFRTVRIYPDVVAGNVFKDGNQMTLWVSDDANKLPLLIESPISVGSVKAVLKSYKGLKYNLDSEIYD
ncbi:MAG: DUF3108 domain-containing protein [Saprospiraceae bacterium]|jgi:hypothetical protein|nr:DUF3108 domain-containing protein [Saprospiraceae bacterium]